MYVLEFAAKNEREIHPHECNPVSKIIGRFTNITSKSLAAN